jgi:hypothetical protein
VNNFPGTRMALHAETRGQETHGGLRKDRPASRRALHGGSTDTAQHSWPVITSSQ